MLNNITDQSTLSNNSTIKQQQELARLEGIQKNKNPYAKSDSLMDQSSISEEAIKLYEQEKDMNKYKSLVLNSLNEDDNSLGEISSLIDNGKYEISNEDLANAILGSGEFDDLF
ncbi:MAG: hypothetical protein PHV68_00310 [Candidatus Gastranaerophilales bacterium]|nr:hypothetical protein [Candidatus Gastranaerophilales bacterium]